MKKVISVLLLVALCIGCFAGCKAKEDPALNSAAEYLYAMYKDAKATTNADYTVVSQVRINDVVYPITWTADKADNVVVNAPHTAAEIAGQWNHPYTRQQAVLPLEWVGVSKFFPYVSKIDNGYGDRNLVAVNRD